MLKATRNDVRSVQFASEQVRANADFMAKAVEINWRALQYATEELKRNRKFLLRWDASALSKLNRWRLLK